MVDIYLIPRPGPGPVESLIVRYVTYLPSRLVGWYMYHVCEPASKQAKDKTGRYKACSVLLLGMSRDRRTPCSM